MHHHHQRQENHRHNVVVADGGGIHRAQTAGSSTPSSSSSSCSSFSTPSLPILSTAFLLRGGLLSGGLVSPPPTDQLMEKIRRRDWDSVRCRIVEYPWDASYRPSPPLLTSSAGGGELHQREQPARQRGQRRGGRGSVVRTSSSSSISTTTALHIACLYRAPYDIIKMLIASYPTALHLHDSDGWIPLHVNLLYGNDNSSNSAGQQQCKNNNEKDTTIMLIEYGGSRSIYATSKFVGSSLHVACRHDSSKEIIKAMLNAVATTTTPTTTTCTPAKKGTGGCEQRGCPTTAAARQRKKQKKQKQKHLVCTPNECGCYPTNLLWKAAIKKHEMSLKMMTTTKRPRNSSRLVQHPEETTSNASFVYQIQYETAYELLEKLNLLLKAAKGEREGRYNDNDNDDNAVLPLLHDVLLFQNTIYANETNMVGLMLRLYPESATKAVKNNDKTGCLPIHVAASLPPITRCWKHLHGHRHLQLSSSSSSSILLPSIDKAAAAATVVNIGGDHHQHDTLDTCNDDLDDEDPLRLLLHSYPYGARCIDKYSRLPIHIALLPPSQRQRRDNVYDSNDFGRCRTANNGSSRRRFWTTGISHLVKAAPESLLHRCPRTKLLPFQLAAVKTTMTDAGSSLSDFDDDDELLEQVKAEGEEVGELLVQEQEDAVVVVCGEDEDDDDEISIITIYTIWELLRSCPHALYAATQTAIP